MNAAHPVTGGAGSGLRADAFADVAGLKERHRTEFAVPWFSRSATIAIVLLLLALIAYAMVQLDFSLWRLINGVGRLGDFVVLMFPPTPGNLLPAFLHAMAETLAIAFLGTLAAALLAFPVAFLAASNVVRNGIVHFAVRRVFDVIRSVDTLIWALIWINVVGLGPFAGALAIASSDFGSFGKLFAEAIETTGRKAVDGVAAAGGSRPAQIRFGLMPQVLPLMASQVLYYFESNTRSATIIGIVGAGGIGQYLTELIRALELQQVAFLIIMILITVGVIDFISTRLRMAIIGRSRIDP